MADTVGRDTGGQRFALKMLQRAAITNAGAHLEGLDVEYRAGFNLHLDVAGVLAGEVVDILIRKIKHLLRSVRDDVAAQPETEEEEQGGGDEVWPHQAAVTDSAGQDSDDLTIARHLTGEENDGDEDEQRTEHIHVVGHEVEIVVQYDLAKRHLRLKEVVHLLRQIEDDGDRENEHDREKECAQKLLDNIEV